MSSGFTSGFAPVCKAGELSAGGRRVVRVGEVEVALVNVDGELYALENACPHRGGPLGEGDLEGHLLHCPLHAWPFDVRTGRCTLYPEAQVRTRAVRVRDGVIEISRSPTQ
jgi:nitrite reductase (NADH) small subunit